MSSSPSSLKRIDAIIQPFRLDDVKEALQEKGVHRLLVNDIRCTDRHLDGSIPIPDIDFLVDFAPAIHLMLIVPEQQVEMVIEAIKAVTQHDDNENGFILLSNIESMIPLGSGAVNG